MDVFMLLQIFIWFEYLITSRLWTNEVFSPGIVDSLDVIFQVGGLKKGGLIKLGKKLKSIKWMHFYTKWAAQGWKNFDRKDP